MVCIPLHADLAPHIGIDPALKETLEGAGSMPSLQPHALAGDVVWPVLLIRLNVTQGLVDIEDGYFDSAPGRQHTPSYEGKQVTPNFVLVFMPRQRTVVKQLGVVLLNVLRGLHGFFSAENDIVVFGPRVLL
jgi:hypothetical protein